MRRRGSGPSARGRRSSCSSGPRGIRRQGPARRRESSSGPGAGRPLTASRAGPKFGPVTVTLNGLDPQLLLLIVPIALVQLGLLVAAIIDLLRDDRAVRGGNKGLWAVVIVFVNLIGPVLYFLVGRLDGPPPDTAPAPGAVPGWGSPHDPRIATSRRPEPRVPGAPESSVVVATARAPLPTGSPPAVAIEGLTRRYPGGVLALDALTLEVPA